MDKNRRDKLVDQLLVKLNDEIDESGKPPKVVHFSFLEESDRDLCEQLGVSFDELTKLLDFCLARSFMEHNYLGSGAYGHLSLTEEGTGRARSVDAAARNPRMPQPTGGHINIGTINSTGATQVGHNNEQTIVNLVEELSQAIDQSNSTDEKKAEAKGLLQRLTENSLIASLLGVAASKSIL